jgi:hypothetical protein
MSAHGRGRDLHPHHTSPLDRMGSSVCTETKKLKKVASHDL